jgi:hypothetical protein
MRHCSLGGPVASIRSELIVLPSSRELTTTIPGHCHHPRVVAMNRVTQQLVFVSHSLESCSQPRTYRYNKLSKLKSIFQLKIKYKSMKDSGIARRDDDNPVVFVRRYRRANEVASPVST